MQRSNTCITKEKASLLMEKLYQKWKSASSFMRTRTGDTKWTKVLSFLGGVLYGSLIWRILYLQIDRNRWEFWSKQWQTVIFWPGVFKNGLKAPTNSNLSDGFGTKFSSNPDYSVSCLFSKAVWWCRSPGVSRWQITHWYLYDCISLFYSGVKSPVEHKQNCCCVRKGFSEPHGCLWYWADTELLHWALVLRLLQDKQPQKSVKT